MRLQDHAYVLHVKPYRETSAIVRVLTRQHGLVAGVVKGVYAKNKKAQQLRSCLQPASEIEVEWLQQAASLKTFTQLDLSAQAQLPTTKAFLCLTYANELTLKLCEDEQTLPELFPAYSRMLELLQHEDLLETALRIFEVSLLSLLGIMIDLSWDMQKQQQVDAQLLYTIEPEQGVREAHADDRFCCRGEVLLALSRYELASPDVLPYAKVITRMLLQHALGGRELNSRKMYRQLLS